MVTTYTTTDLATIIDIRTTVATVCQEHRATRVQATRRTTSSPLLPTYCHVYLEPWRSSQPQPRTDISGWSTAGTAGLFPEVDLRSQAQHLCIRVGNLFFVVRPCR